MGKIRPVHYQQFDDVGTAKQSEYKRLVSDNQALQGDLRAFRARHNLPFINLQAQIDWLQRQTAKAFETADRENLTGPIPIPEYDEWLNELRALAKKHKASRWVDDIVSLGLWGQARTNFSKGLPGINIIKDIDGRPLRGDDGQPIFEPAIPPDYDPSNPLEQQALSTLRSLLDKPPIRRTGDTDFKRKLWEWHLRNPNITDKEIAKHFGWSRRATVAEIWRRFRQGS